MEELNRKIGFIGAGNMGEAFIGAILRSKLSAPSKIYVCDIRKERLNMICNQYGILPLEDQFKLFSECNIVILSVKPQQIGRLLSQITAGKNYRIEERKLIISIAAGITLQKIEGLLYPQLDENDRKKLPIIRVMPNTPALVLAGMCGMSTNRYVIGEDVKLTRAILEAMGRVVEFKEECMDAVTALSGSGPAYVFYLVESMIEAGKRLGLNPQDAATLTLTTLKGSAKLLEERKESPEILRQKVTSPGGTTEAALKVMENNKVKQTIITAIEAAAKRSKELSRSDS
ncbi:MAG: pyrroline-5-carboxylate reductase [Desulfobacterales bacterium]|nr:pyrroline-5-carboxylate reductase [Desulfobacterales bacterium]